MSVIAFDSHRAQLKSKREYGGTATAGIDIIVDALYLEALIGSASIIYISIHYFQTF